MPADAVKGKDLPRPAQPGEPEAKNAAADRVKPVDEGETKPAITEPSAPPLNENEDKPASPVNPSATEK
jgi:hypothetical protein